MKYSWLIDEAKEIKTNKFFLFHKNADPKVMEAIEQEFGPLPDDYKSFVAQFGDSWLFRDMERGSYYMAIYSRPRLRVKEDTQFLEIGWSGRGNAFFKRGNRGQSAPTMIFEWSIFEPRRGPASFEEWLKRSFSTGRRKYGKREWTKILAGPEPFTEEELKIVEAIPLFTFEKVGISNNGDIQIKVHNGSQRRLQYLSIGVLIPKRLEGGLFLNVANIGPGETQILEEDAYKDLGSPEDVELFRKSVPEPSERRMYSEFR